MQLRRAHVSEANSALPRHEEDLHIRIRAEFLEMPGLKLTLPQAARLFDLEAGRCQRVLGALVEDGALTVNGGRFVRATAAG